MIQNGHCEEAQENSERHYHEISNNIIVRKEFCTKETEALKSQQTKILELKNPINKMKNSLASTGNRADCGRNSELEDINLEMIQIEDNRELRSLKSKEILQEFSDSFIRGNRVMGTQEEKRGRRE